MLNSKERQDLEQRYFNIIKTSPSAVAAGGVLTDRLIEMLCAELVCALDLVAESQAKAGSSRLSGPRDKLE